MRVVVELQRDAMVAKVLEQINGLVAKVLELSAMVVPKAMVVKFPSKVVTDELKLAVIMQVLTAVILIIREAPKVVMKGARVEKDNEIVVEAEAVMLEVVAAKVLDMDPKAL